VSPPITSRTEVASPSLQRAARDLAEIAIDAPSREAFAHSSLEVLTEALSMDAGAINRTTSALDVSIDSVGLRPERLRQSILEYLDELSPEELRRALSGSATLDGHLFAPDRKERLRLYSEYLVPGRIHGFCCLGWLNRHGAFWVTMSRAGRNARYTAADLSGLEALAPVLSVGEALHAAGARASDPGSRLPEDYARERGLTRAEFQVAELVARGLSNEAAGLVLGRSKNTVRNQLASAFAKLRVCTRADLVSALRAARPGHVPSHRPGTLAIVLASESEKRSPRSRSAG
jgi:DNA-binding CsgD family transcriptional regulator